MTILFLYLLCGAIVASLAYISIRRRLGGSPVDLYRSSKPKKYQKMLESFSGDEKRLRRMVNAVLVIIFAVVAVLWPIVLLGQLGRKQKSKQAPGA